ncbi:hypothetical protein M3X88_28425 (plasmid) [Klebsiella pneumoniae]|nr:hypothetical protein [Klebsiella pneumoniae]URI67654.1 hypothetical protein M3X88_28425 [Klebsiella pneumoniae]
MNPAGDVLAIWNGKGKGWRLRKLKNEARDEVPDPTREDFVELLNEKWKPSSHSWLWTSELKRLAGFLNNKGAMEIMKDMMIDIEAERFNEWLEKITRMLSPNLKNGSRPRTCITGNRRHLLIRLSGIMNTGSSWFP